jgi:hypothetical protein
LKSAIFFNFLWSEKLDALRKTVKLLKLAKRFGQRTSEFSWATPPPDTPSSPPPADLFAVCLQN